MITIPDDYHETLVLLLGILAYEIPMARYCGFCGSVNDPGGDGMEHEDTCPTVLATVMIQHIQEDGWETELPYDDFVALPRALGNNGHDCPNEFRCNDTCPDCGYEWPLPF